MDGGRVLLVLGPNAPVDRSAIGGFCERWSRELGAELAVAAAGQLVEEHELTGVVFDPGDDDPSPVLAAAVDRGLPVALVSTRAATDAPGARDSEHVFRIAGRGIAGYRWGALHVLRRAAWPVLRVAYGEHPEQVADLRLPDGSGPHPVVVLVHGGGWKDVWRREIMDGAAVDLARRGYASWNVDFRRVGPSGGGWPATFDDLDAGVRALRAQGGPLDLDRVAIVGHSSGVSSRSRRPPEASTTASSRSGWPYRSRAWSTSSRGRGAASSAARRSSTDCSAARPRRCPSATAPCARGSCCRSACPSSSCRGSTTTSLTSST